MLVGMLIDKKKRFRILVGFCVFRMHCRVDADGSGCGGVSCGDRSADRDG